MTPQTGTAPSSTAGRRQGGGHLPREQQRELLVRVAEQVGEGVAVFDVDDWLVYANPALASLHGCSPEELVGQPLATFTGPPPGGAEDRQAAEAAGAGVLRGELSSFRLDGSRLDVHVTVSSLVDDSGSRLGRIVCVRDVSAQKQLEEQLERAALHDPLTELPNRRLLSDRINQALAAAERTGRAVAVLFIDLDGFKQVNDAHGHDVGDQLLVQVAGRFKGCVRPGDTLARLGGDEFIVLLADLPDADEPVRVARRLCGVLHEPFVLGDVTVRISTSIGLALSMSGSERTILHAADHAMYQAKGEGPGRVVVSEWCTTSNAPSVDTSWT